jgi:hypothetical protein
MISPVHLRNAVGLNSNSQTKQGKFKLMAKKMSSILDEPPQEEVLPEVQTVEGYQKEKDQEIIFESLKKFKNINEINASFGG